MSLRYFHFFFAALAPLAGCLSYQGPDQTDASTSDASDATAAVDGSPEAASDGGADVGTPPVDAADGAALDANEAGTPILVLLSAAAGPSVVPDSGTPFEKDVVAVTRASATSKLYLSSAASGGSPLYVDDNVHFIVTPSGGSPNDRYFEFWGGYPCPAASTTPPPGGDGSGNSPPIDVSAMFSPDTTIQQTVTLEFWHCASHVPAPHSAFYLVEK